MLKVSPARNRKAKGSKKAEVGGHGAGGGAGRPRVGDEADDAEDKRKAGQPVHDLDKHVVDVTEVRLHGLQQQRRTRACATTQPNALGRAKRRSNARVGFNG